MKKGKVIQSTGSWYKVVTSDGEIIKCRLRGKLRLNGSTETNPVAVGDEVELSNNDDGSGTILTVLGRKNKIIRQATHGRRGEQVIAANVDLAFSVQSVRNPRYKTGFIDRFLVTCEAYGVQPVILINKSDLADEQDMRELEELKERYGNLGYLCIISSIYDEKSLVLLRQITVDKVSVFIGPSGTGKTSLLNTLDPALKLATGEVSHSSGKGKHTTTFAELIPLSYGARFVDTPGIREFGLVDIEPAELSLHFPEMRELRENCRYYNCTHVHEPGCAVQEELDAGRIHEDRYRSYLRILESLARG